jgi:Domain of unknown function (DUF4158)
MKQDWHPEELAHHWTLSAGELELLGTKTGATRLSFAILLKASNRMGVSQMGAKTLPVALLRSIFGDTATSCSAKLCICGPT